MPVEDDAENCCESRKDGSLLVPVTWTNAGQCSKLFHLQTKQ